MTSQFFKDFGDKTQESLAPLVKFNELLSASMQDMFKAQMAATKRYSEMTMEQVKAATEIRDVESLQSFFQKQLGAYEAFNEQFMADLKAMSDAGIKFKSDVESIINPVQGDDEQDDKTTTKAKGKAEKTAS